jgi:HD-GYP domain-containing protein (c-di-GMP phosphodiesterase class II)
VTGRSIRLCGVSPEIAGKVWKSEKLLRIGRLEDLEVVLNDASISRRHAEIALTDQGWIIRDLGSTNGTFLNSVRVGRADQPLRQHDRVECGSLVLTVEVIDEEVLSSVESRSSSVQVEAAIQNSWEQALQLITGEGSPQPSDQGRLLALLRIGRDCGSNTSLESLLQSILQDTVAAVRAQRGCLVLVDEATGQLTPRAVVPVEPDPGEPAWLAKNLIRRAFERRESWLGHHGRPEQAPGRWFASGGQPKRSVLCVLLRSPRKRLGVLYLERAADQEPFNQADLYLGDALAASASASIETVAHFVEKERNLCVQMLTTLAQAVDLRDEYTGSHTQRVTDYALLLAEELRLPPVERQLLQIGTPLHDIGKIGISDAILRKPGPLTEDEFAYMKSHTWKGATILEIIPHLAPIIPIVRSHHERWDGKGYPDHLAGSEISPLGRIVAIADAFDAMTTDRPYRSGMALETVFEEIRRKAGTHFDPAYAEAFLRLRPRLEELLSQHRLLLETTARVEARERRPPPANRKRTGLLPKLAPAVHQPRSANAFAGPEPERKTPVDNSGPLNR